ncbi:hypothetical protein KFL_007900010 [Klebsormidium nitens]|uniref:Uncharacterized protein n=1 Tax=Klebsormidium nitens TaxID=105231 RepID=A0A1Y1IRU5_KLENI|nr:hypothetical protein KFL_007900010 [Klebsormidium nitens]|eukprot:GAQ91466.1 hypothetical protein KFL_007900010 [Klebsormidium nitens]
MHSWSKCHQEVKLPEKFSNFFARVIVPAQARVQRLQTKGKVAELTIFLGERVKKYQSSESAGVGSSRSQVDDFRTRYPRLLSLLEESSSCTLAELFQPSSNAQEAQKSREIRQDILSKVLSKSCPLSNRIVLELEALWVRAGEPRSSVVSFLQGIDPAGLGTSKAQSVDMKLSRLCIAHAAARKSKDSLQPAFLSQQDETLFVVGKPSLRSEPIGIATLQRRLRRVTADRDLYIEELCDVASEQRDAARAEVDKLEQELAKLREASALRILDVEGRVEILEEKIAWSFEENVELQDQMEELTFRLAGEKVVTEERDELILQLAAAQQQVDLAQADLAAALEAVAVSKLLKKGARLNASPPVKQRLVAELKRNAKKRSSRHEAQVQSLREELDVLQAKLDCARAAATTAQGRASNVLKACQRKERQEAIKVEKLREENAQLRERLEEFLSEIKTFENGQYIAQIREVYYELLELNVASGQIERVLRLVLWKLAGRKLGKLPSESLCKEFYREMLALSHLHLAEVFGGEAEEADTLHSDGTSKWQDKFTGFQLTRLEPVKVERGGRMVTELVQRSYTLGMRQVADGTAEGALEMLKEILGDVERAQRSIDPSSKEGSVVTSIVSKIKNTTSDR